MEPRPPDPPVAARPEATYATTLVTRFSGVVVLVGAFVAFGLGPMVIEAQQGYCGNQDHPGACPELAGFVVVGALIALPGVWGLVIARNLRRHRPWARTAVLATFGGYAAATVVGAGAFVVLPEDPAWGGVLAALLALSVFARVIRATLRDHSPTEPPRDG